MAMIKSLQSLRLLGIITIVAGHAGLSLWGGGDWCSFFFVLSGFLYKTEVKDWQDYGNYIWRKAKSIYPVYWFCLVSYIVLAYIRGCVEQYTIGWDVIPHLLLLQSWIPGIEPMAYLGPAWFLSSLLFCYCLSPVVKRAVAYSPYSITAIVAFYLFWTCLLGFDTYISPVYRLGEYAFGMWLRAFASTRETSHELFTGFNILLVTLLLCLIRMGIPVWVEILSFGIIISVLASYSSRLSDYVLGNNFIVGIAKADIFIYLIHPGIAFHLAMFLFGHDAIIMVICSLIVGYVMYWVYNWSFR